MSIPPDGDPIRRQFQQLRRQDETQAPPYSTTRQAALRGRQTARRPGWQRRRYQLAAAGLAVALAGSAGLVRWLAPAATPPPADLSAALRLARWRAPTDSLLAAPGDQLLHAVPRLDEPSLGGNLSLGGHGDR